MLGDLAIDGRRDLRLFLVVDGADVGRDGEARRHRQAGVGHLGEAGALAAEQVLHGAVAVGLAVAEEVHVLASLAAGLATSGASLAAFFAIDVCVRHSCRNDVSASECHADLVTGVELPCSSAAISEMSPNATQRREVRQQRQPRLAQRRIVRHHQHVVEELDRRLGRRVGQPRRNRLGSRLPDRRVATIAATPFELVAQRQFGRLRQVPAERPASPATPLELPRDVLDALEEPRPAAWNVRRAATRSGSASHAIARRCQRRRASPTSPVTGPDFVESAAALLQHVAQRARSGTTSSRQPPSSAWPAAEHPRTRVEHRASVEPARRRRQRRQIDQDLDDALRRAAQAVRIARAGRLLARREQADDRVELVGERHGRPRRRPPCRAARATAARRLRRRPAGSGSRSPSRPPRAALLRARRCRPSCPAAR